MSHFLGIKFKWIRHSDGELTIKLSQEAFVDSLGQIVELYSEELTLPPTLYRSGLPVDSVSNKPPEH